MDLSGGGIRFTTEQEQKPDSWILAELRLKSQTMDNQYYIVANVIETSKIESAAEYRFMSRAKFSIKNDRVREEIIRYIFEEERRMRQQNSSERIKNEKNILVVDDSALMRRVICDIINSDETFQAIDTCRDGLDALEKLRAKRYDGVVLDVNMPRMDGLALLEQLQKERIRATVIMVSTTTTKDAEVTMLAMERGAVDFVPKPTNVIEAKGEAFKGKLLGVLNAVLKTQKMALGSKSAATPEK